MGLGVPWFLYSLFGTFYDGRLRRPVYTCMPFCDLLHFVLRTDHGSFVFYGMEAGGVLFPVIVLLFLVVLFLGLLLSTGWQLLKWHAYLFITIYVGFVIWVLAAKSIQPCGFDD